MSLDEGTGIYIYIYISHIWVTVNYGTVQKVID